MQDEVARIFREHDEIKRTVPNENSLYALRDRLEQYSSVLLYGAGSAGIAMHSYLRAANISVAAFLDGCEAKWGSRVEGCEVFSPEAAAGKWGSKPLVIVTINTNGKAYCRSFDEALRAGGHGAVHTRLRQAGFADVVDYQVFRNYTELFAGDRFNLPSCSDVVCMEKNAAKIDAVYAIMADELSRKTFLDILSYRLLSVPIEFTNAEEENEYFACDLYRPIPDEMFVDCGAYDGNTLALFLKKNGEKFRHYIGLEPDPDNFVRLEARVADYPAGLRERIMLISAAAYDRNGEGTLYALRGPGSFMAPEGTQRVRCVRLDDAIGSTTVTLIKMNIEGSECAALSGAQQIIVRDAPVMVVSAYHKTWDLWEIPLMLQTLHPGYTFYLRTYMDHISFKVYAVPENRRVQNS